MGHLMVSAFVQYTSALNLWSLQDGVDLSIVNIILNILCSIKSPFIFWSHKFRHNTRYRVGGSYEQTNPLFSLFSVIYYFV